MLFHSLRTKVLSSLRNNTQQPFIKSPEARVLLLSWLLIWEKTARLVSPYHSHHSRKTTYLPTELSGKISG